MRHWPRSQFIVVCLQGSFVELFFIALSDKCKELFMFKNFEKILCIISKPLKSLKSLYKKKLEWKIIVVDYKKEHLKFIF